MQAPMVHLCIAGLALMKGGKVEIPNYAGPNGPPLYCRTGIDEGWQRGDPKLCRPQWSTSVLQDWH